MTCYFCTEPIGAGQIVNHHHHTTLRSGGGTKTAPSHQTCHRNHHSSEGHFREWGREGGKQSAITGRWSLNLRNVKDDPRHELTRSYYRALYAH